MLNLAKFSKKNNFNKNTTKYWKGKFISNKNNNKERVQTIKWLNPQ